MREVVVYFLDGSSKRITGVQQAPKRDEGEYSVYDSNAQTYHYFPKKNVREMTYGYSNN